MASAGVAALEPRSGSLPLLHPVADDLVPDRTHLFRVRVTLLFYLGGDLFLVLAFGTGGVHVAVWSEDSGSQINGRTLAAGPIARCGRAGWSRPTHVLEAVQPGQGAEAEVEQINRRWLGTDSRGASPGRGSVAGENGFRSGKVVAPTFVESRALVQQTRRTERLLR